MPRLTLLPPDPRRVPAPLSGAERTPGQAQALGAFAQGQDVLVHGAPGSGRTRLALSAALEAPGDRVVLLAPRRTGATALRDAAARAGAAARIHAATPAALGFAVVRAAAPAAGQGEPSLVTGAEQDALVHDLVAEIAEWEVPLEPATRTLPGFRAELRDVITRATELGLRPADLERLAEERGRPAWRDAARVLRLYLDVLDLEASAALDAGARYDSGRMVREGARLIAAGQGPAISALVVDDAQDLTAAGIALIRAIASRGVRVLVTTCPDEMVDSFRGAVPDAARRIADASAREPVRILLPDSQRTPPGAAAVVGALRARLPLSGALTALRRPAADAATDRVPGAVSVLRAPGDVEEARRIATVLRDLHHAREIPYDDMAIICRSGAVVDDLADRLQRQGLPVSAAERPRPLREEPVVRDLLAVLELAVQARTPSAEEAADLLRGPFGDADALRLRRIRRSLLAAAPENADPLGAPGSADLLARALVAEEVPGLPGPRERDRAATPVHRIRRMIAAVRGLGPHPAATDALWAAWDAARLAEGWREASLETDDLDGAGARGRLAARRLDAVSAMFASVERFTDRRPRADALVFAEHVRTSAVAEDTLAARAQPTGRVRVTTPAAIAGEEMRVVVLAHLQEGAWPNTRLRSTLFGAAELQLVADHPELPLEPAALRAAQRELVLADEIRLAVSALARSSELILVTAVQDEDTAPSALLEAIEAAAEDPWLDPAVLTADPGPAPDPRRLVAALRRRLADPGTAPPERAGAARLLAALEEAGAPGADPRGWYHQEPSSEAELLPPEAPVRLSPSALERAHACPQSWLLERAGGSPAPGPAQSIGTAVHRIAQDHPDGTGDLLADLNLLLAPLHLDRLWSTRRLLTRAEDAVALLAQHLQVTGLPLAVEAPFSLERDGVRLRGSIDRIEGDATGLRVVDLKTGRSPKSRAAAAEDLQLAAYQAAVQDGALDDQLGPDAADRLNGAQLVYVGTGSAKPAVRTQGAFATAEDPAWFDRILTDTAAQVRGARVAARPNEHCSRCTVRRTCALFPEGAEL